MLSPSIIDDLSSNGLSSLSPLSDPFPPLLSQQHNSGVSPNTDSSTAYETTTPTLSLFLSPGELPTTGTTTTTTDSPHPIPQHISTTGFITTAEEATGVVDLMVGMEKYGRPGQLQLVEPARDQPPAAAMTMITVNGVVPVTTQSQQQHHQSDDDSVCADIDRWGSSSFEDSCSQVK